MSYTPSFVDQECRDLKRSTGMSVFPPQNYTRVEVKGRKNKVIAKCYQYLARDTGWCGTCIESAEHPGDRGYCQATALDPTPLANLNNYTGESIQEVRVLETINKASIGIETSDHWGICSEGCRLSYLPNTLQEAKLTLLEDQLCNGLLKQDLRFHSKTELCAAKYNKLKIRNYRKEKQSKYKGIPDKMDPTYGGVDACFGDSGNSMYLH